MASAAPRSEEGPSRPAPVTGIARLQVAPDASVDLWVQPLDGRAARRLTRTGRLTAFPRAGTQSMGGAAVSPDGHWIAYGERPTFEGDGGPGVAGWQTLHVVRPDGTGARTVLELSVAPLGDRKHPVLQLPRPDGAKRPWPRDLRWSADGRHLVFAVTEWDPAPASAAACTHARIYSVEVASGRTAELLRTPSPGDVQLLGWWPERRELALYSDACSRPPQREGVGAPREGTHGQVVIAKLDGGSVVQQRALAPSLSPDGQWLFVSSFVEAAPVRELPAPAPGKPRMQVGGELRLTSPTLYRYTPATGLGPGQPLAGAFTAHLRWVGDQPLALLETLPHVPFGEPVIADGGPDTVHALLRLDARTGELRPVRSDASGLTLVDASPDGAHVLVGITPARPTDTSPAYELYRVRRADLEAGLPLRTLRERGVRLRGQGCVATWGCPEYVGWIR